MDKVSSSNMKTILLTLSFLGLVFSQCTVDFDRDIFPILTVRMNSGHRVGSSAGLNIGNTSDSCFAAIVNQPATQVNTLSRINPGNRQLR